MRRLDPSHRGRGVLASSLTLVLACAPALHSGEGSAARRRVPGAPDGITAFVNVAVVPMDTERVLPSQTVLVEDGWIAAIGSTSELEVPAAARRINGQGKYLIPGLSDCHAHVAATFKRDSTPPDTIAQRRLFLWLADGITTIRNLDYMDANENFLLGGEGALRLRARVAAGELWSPWIYTAGQWAPKQYTSDAWPKKAGRPQPRLDSVSVYVAAYQKAGYDFLKVHDESPEIFEAVLAAAREVGMPVVGHVRGTLEQAFAGGMTSIEHLSEYPSGREVSVAEVKAIAEATRRAGVWNCVNMQAGGIGAHPATVRALQDAGAGILLGSDEPLGAGIRRELEMLIEAGLTPYEALATGTKNMAAYLGQSDISGTIAAGKRADLVLLNGNPLQDITNVKQPAGVMIGGRWLDRQTIDRRLAEIEAAGGALMPNHNRVRQSRAAASE